MRRLLLMALLGAAACAPQPNASGCQPAPQAVLDVLQGTLIDQGGLRHGFTSTAGGLVLVSAELHPADDPAGKKGEVLTFVAIGGTYEAVDRYARKRSRLPAASFDVRKDGVYHSRACAAANRGA